MLLMPIEFPTTGSDQTYTLIDGTSIPSIYVTFDPLTYRFTYNDGTTSTDITDNLKRADKNTFPAFDPTIDNNRISLNSRGITGPAALQLLPTNVGELFAQNVAQDLSNKASQISSAANIVDKYLLPVAGILIGLYVLNMVMSKRK